LSLSVLSRREARVVAGLLDAVVGSQRSELPPPGRTGALGAFDRLLAAAPPVNRRFLRALLWAVELGPVAGPWRRPMRRLSGPERVDYLDRLERLPAARPLRGVLALVKLAYYGEPDVMARLGYDADPVVARGRALRLAEGRP
jgi:hypothetical protein